MIYTGKTEFVSFVDEYETGWQLSKEIFEKRKEDKHFQQLHQFLFTFCLHVSFFWVYLIYKYSLKFNIYSENLWESYFSCQKPVTNSNQISGTHAHAVNPHLKSGLSNSWRVMISWLYLCVLRKRSVSWNC